MNDLTSWDNYSDISSDEEQDVYRSATITETGKQCMLKKYMNYVKEAMSESELKEVFLSCNYKDEQIKKLVDDKMNKYKFKDWEGNSNLNKRKKINTTRQASHGIQTTINVNNYFNNNQKQYTNTNRFNNQINRQSPIIIQHSLNGFNEVENKNLNSNHNINNDNVNDNVNPKKNFNYNRVNNNLHVGSNYLNNNYGYNNEASYKSEHENVLCKNDDLIYKKYKNDFNSRGNELSINNSNNINKDTIEKVIIAENYSHNNNISRLRRSSTKDKFVRTTSKQRKSSVIKKIPQENEETFDYYLDAALKLNTGDIVNQKEKLESKKEVPQIVAIQENKEIAVLNQINEVINKKDEIHVEGSLKSESLKQDDNANKHRGASKSILSKDLKELVGEIKKNKDKFLKQKENIALNTFDVTKSSDNELNLQNLNSIKDKDKMEIMNISLTIGSKDERSNEKVNDQEKSDKTNYDIPHFDFAKIPNNVLNAKNYGDYFFSQNSVKDKTSNKEPSQNKDVYVNMNMSMNMNMNMRKNPEFPLYQGYIHIPNQVFTGQPVISPMGQSTNFNYKFPPIDPSTIKNPYYMPYNFFPFNPMQMYPYPIHNPNMNYFCPPNPKNNPISQTNILKPTNETNQYANEIKR